MAEMTRYEPGTPSWVDLSSTDIAQSVAFYNALFGWEAQDQGEDAAHYTIFSLRGKSVCAVGPKMAEDPSPPNWTTYFSVANADATAKDIEAAGGTILAPPFDVMTAGRMAIAMDPTGGAFAIWEPREHIGAELVNEPGTLCWNELNARDLDAALAFYTKVFGLEATTDTNPMNYRELQLNGRTVAGSMPMPAVVPDMVPTHWLPYFGVVDTDASVATATSHGAAVLMPAMDIEIGRFAVVSDPQGAVFAMMQFNTPPA